MTMSTQHNFSVATRTRSRANGSGVPAFRRGSLTASTLLTILAIKIEDEFKKIDFPITGFTRHARCRGPVVARVARACPRRDGARCPQKKAAPSVPTSLRVSVAYSGGLKGARAPPLSRPQARRPQGTRSEDPDHDPDAPHRVSSHQRSAPDGKW